MSIMKHNKKAFQSVNPLIGLFIAIAAVSTASIFIRFAQTSYSSLTIAAFRLGISSLVLLPFFLAKSHKDIRSLNINDYGLLFLSGIFLSVHFASWIKSLEMTNVISSVVLVTTTPVWASLFALLFFREKLKGAFYIGLIISLAGGMIISVGDGCSVKNFILDCQFMNTNPEGVSINSGNLLALLGAICAAGYILCGKLLRPKLNNLTYVFLVYLIASILLFSGQIIFEGFEAVILRPEFIWIIFIALIPQLIGHSLINWALGHLPSSYVSLSLLGEPIGSTVLAALFLGELPSKVQIAGAVILILGIYVAIKPISRK